MGGFSTVAGGFFNLDGLQKEEQEQNEKLPEKQKMAIAAIGGDHGASPPPAAAAAVQVVKTPTVIHHHATFPSSIIPSKTTGLVVPSHKTPLKVPSPKKQFPKQTVSELKSPPTTPANVTEPATPPDQQLQSPNQSPATVAPQLLPTKANLLSSSLIQQPTTATEGLSCPSRQPSPPSKISSKDQDSVWQEEQGNDDGVGDIRNKDENIPAEKPKDGDGGDEAEKTNEKEPYLHLPPQPPPKGEIPVCPISEADSVDDNGEGMIPQLVECDSNKDLSTTVALLDSPTNEETRAIESKKQEKETPIAAASIPENVYQQFSNQIQRLEENHEAEKVVLQQQMEAIKRQHLQEVEELQQQQTTWNHKRENYRLQLDSLKRELEGTQQLLEENSKTEKKLQEAHLNQLRGMEKQINHKQDESKGYAGKVQELLVRIRMLFVRDLSCAI